MHPPRVLRIWWILPVSLQLISTLAAGPNPLTDLRLTKEASTDKAFVGDTLTFTLTVQNGTTLSPGTTVTDYVPDEFKILSAAASNGGACAINGQEVVCELGVLLPDQQVVIEIDVEPLQAGLVTNRAEVTSASPIEDPNPDNNRDATTVTIQNRTDLQIQQKLASVGSLTEKPNFTAITEVPIGVPFVYGIIVRNNGPAASPNTVVRDALPAGVTVMGSISVTSLIDGSEFPAICDEAPPGVVCLLGTLEAGAFLYISIEVVAVDSGVVVNTAEIEGDLPDPRPENNSWSVGTIVKASGPLLTLTWTREPEELDLFDGRLVQITLSNVGTETATGVEVFTGFEYPPPKVLSTGSEKCALTSSSRVARGFGSEVKCSVGELAAGDSFKFAMVVVPMGLGFLTIKTQARSTNANYPKGELILEVRSEDGVGQTSVELIRGSGPGGKQQQVLDLYLDEALIADDIAPGEVRQVTGIELSTALPKVRIADGGDPDPSTPIDSFFVDLAVVEADSVRLSTRNAFFLVEGTDSLDLLVKRDLRLEANDSSQVEFFVALAAPDLPPLGLHLIDDTPQHTVVQTLANDLPYDSLTGYYELGPAAYNIEVTTADHGRQLGVFRFDFSERAGEALILTASGTPVEGSFALVAIDPAGALVEPQVVTSAGAEATLSGKLVLRGNYPNPSSSRTTLVLDLPTAAQLRVEVVDLFGRRVLVVPSRLVQRGIGRTLEIDATALASGLYFYRVIAQANDRTMAGVGRMILTR